MDTFIKVIINHLSWPLQLCQSQLELYTVKAEEVNLDPVSLINF